MFGGYAEGVAYASMLDEDEFGVSVALPNSEEKDGGIICSNILSSTSAFGSFKTWPQEDTDFILIAECSEICGPNPICTIPSNVSTNINLSTLSVLLLSADFQEFSSNKSVPTKDTQVLMPDVMDNIHAAVNHFVIYDPEARGFVRSLCMAYVASDKHKLIEMDKEIFKQLAEASFLIQHSNRSFSKKGLSILAQGFTCAKSELMSRTMAYPNDIGEDLKLYDELIKSSLQEIRDILNCITSPMETDAADELINNFIHELIKKFDPKGCFDFILETNNTCDLKPKILKLPVQQDFNKDLRNLFVVSPGGSLMAFYHLHLIHKYFSRKYEDIFLESCVANEDNYISNVLHFGACLKLNSWVKGQDQGQCDVHFCDSCPNLSIYHKSYALNVDADFCSSILHILKSIFHEKQDLESIAIVQQNSKGNTSLENFIPDVMNLKCNRHTVPLNKMWSTLEYLNSKIPGIESSTVRFLKMFSRTENLLFSLFTRVPIVIFYNLEDEFLISNFVQVLAALTPRALSEDMLVEHNREQPLTKEDFRNILIATFCSHHKKPNLIPSEIMPAVALLHVWNSSYQGPKYKGFLLNGINSKIKSSSPEMPLFSFLISIFSDIERHVIFWRKISSSASSSQRLVIMFEKGFSKCDIKILKCLSKIDCS